MGVTLNLALSVEGLWCREIILLCVHEKSGLHIFDRHGYSECSVGLDEAKVLGESEFGRGHVVGRGDNTDGGRVA